MFSNRPRTGYGTVWSPISIYIFRRSVLPNSLTLVVGFDQREAISYHTFCQSVLEKSSIPVRFIPLAENTLQFYRENHKNISNRFVFSRFLTPYLLDFQGMAVFADGDMVCQTDIKNLWDLRDTSKAVQVVQHDYQTKAHTKYLGNKNENYPRKNWSSLILWNCAHPSHRVLTPTFIQSQTGAYLHRFSWLSDSDIGLLPMSWNWLAIEYPDNPSADLVHYTLGTPCFKEYADSPMSPLWHQARSHSQEGMGE
ncbi:MAG: glycosyltransferase [Betaproteobacteria bacterium]|nr:glycosyltransferase [Betaproteobacteria bacterium]